MTRLVVLLRGINVGGHHKLPMAVLRDGLAAAGCTDVATYIQSGNAVLVPPTSAPEDPSSWLEQVITDVAGFPVPVVVRTAAAMEAIVAGNPYPEAGGSQLHVVLFARPPDGEVLADIDLDSFAPESCTWRGSELYLHLPDGMGRAKLPVALERAGRRSGVAQGTTRNWNTVLKLTSMATS